MPLLELVTRESLDLDYATWPGGGPPGCAAAPWPRTRGAAVAVGVFGLLVPWPPSRTPGTRTSRRPAATRWSSASRCAEDAVSSLQDRIARPAPQNDELRRPAARVRAASTPTRRRSCDDLELSTGFAAVTGPGLRVTVDDQPQGDPDGRVRATDLRVLVNGLWQAGAEAIAINGRRLTSLSAIVNSGIADPGQQGAAVPALRRPGHR